MDKIDYLDRIDEDEHPHGMADNYSDEFNDAIDVKRATYAPMMNRRVTVKVPLTYAADEPAVEDINYLLARHNNIKEEGKYFVFNNKRRVKKAAFLQSIYSSEYLSKMLVEDTTGDMFLTIDPVWFGRASDSDSWTTWESCYRPGGDFETTPLEMATSEQFLMAIILNSSHTKIIGRRFIFIPTNKEGKMAKAVFFLSRYGTFPPRYQKSLVDFIASKLYGDNPREWTTSRDYREIRDAINQNLLSTLECVNIPEDVSSSKYYHKLHIDNPQQMAIKNGFDWGGDDEKWYIEFNGYEHYRDDDMADYATCSWCREMTDIDEMTTVQTADEGEQLVCPNCHSDYVSYLPLYDIYVYTEDTVEAYVRDTLFGTGVWKRGLCPTWEAVYCLHVLDDDGDIQDESMAFANYPHLCAFNLPEWGDCVFLMDMLNGNTELRDAFLKKLEESEESDESEDSN